MADIASNDAEASDPEPNKGDAPSVVKFASVDEKIEPNKQASRDSASTNPQLHDDQQAQLQQITQTLQGSRLQERRMSAFAFEPVSLPTSRTTSKDNNSTPASRHNTHSSDGRPSPQPKVQASSMHSPPITPAATNSRDAQVGRTAKDVEKVEAKHDPAVVTPQISPPATSPSVTNISRPSSSGEVAQKPTTESSTSSDEPPQNHRSVFSIGPGTRESPGSSSRETSPSRSVNSIPPTSASIYSKPFAPGGEANDPYAAHKRPPQSKNLDSIDPRFKFTAVGSKHRPTGSTSSSVTLPRSSRSNDSNRSEKRHSFLSGGFKDHAHLTEDSTSSLNNKQGSMSELKRFLKIGNKVKRAASPTPSTKASKPKRTPSFYKAPQQLPFGDDHGLTTKWGKFGKVLGAGAGGSVRLMKRSTDGTTFAVKEFRARHSYESDKEYAKKVTAEFCVGSTLHHGNIIETLDIVQEKGKWYEVMEYAPYDLFAIVMTGKMSREEVTCSFLQIFSGVTYLHSMGLAHRDLKLDNVVVNDQGIMKIIDFGSASVFKYPFEDGTTLASGIVGSDPYLAPEVYEDRKYDPQPADIWSLAIIFCCMSLRRFPWKMPKISDNSYKLFASQPSPGTDITKPHEHHHHASESKSTISIEMPEAANGQEVSKKEPDVIKGPWRLLRLLPRESRHIIGRMLEIDPRKRASLTEVLDGPWVSETKICQQEPSGNVARAEGHTHTLEPPSAVVEPKKYN